MAHETTRCAAQIPRPISHAPACLVHIYPTGPSIGRRYVLGQGVATLGRDDDCSIPATDNSVSRCHARIDSTPYGHAVTDLGSTNGTFVNDRPAVGTCPLRDGDYLRVGNWIFRYLGGGNVEAEYHEEIYRLAILDALTRAYNRRYLMEFLDVELSRVERHGRPLAVLMFDVDKFKTLNDTHGHLFGDFVLRELAGRVRETIRKGDVLARYGGEEFALVLIETPPDRAVEAAERIRALVADTPFRFETRQQTVTISIGVAHAGGESGVTPTTLIAAADERLYQAKQAGRNRVVAGPPAAHIVEKAT